MALFLAPYVLNDKGFPVKLALLVLLWLPTIQALSDVGPPVTPAAKPNVLFILADDLGWMDSTPYGSQYYQTPGLERLAAMGMKFTRAYSASPICSPTRLSLMTGKYPARLNLTGPVGHMPRSHLKSRYSPLPAASYTQVKPPVSARFMPTEEYTLGEAFRDAGYRTGFVGKWHLGLEPEYWPEAQGFDYVFHGAPDAGPGSYFSPYAFKAGTVTNGPRNEYITERATVEAINFIRRAGENPWMLCLWHWAVHAPFQAPQDLIDKYAKLDDPRGHQNNPVMGGMIESLDTSVNTLLDALDSLGLTENTIIVFFSDNGGNLYDEVSGEPPTSNFPLRGGKGTIYEGGTRVPAIIVWPGHTKAGATSDALISSIDMYPTLLEMAGINLTQNHLVDGISITETLRNNERPDRDAIFSHYPHYSIAAKNRPATYVIQGDWKYIRFYDTNGPNGDEPGALYNLAKDMGEQHNLWKDMPNRVAAMDDLITAHLEETQALIPIPNPDYIEGSHSPIYDNPVDSWLPKGPCDIHKENGALRVNSVGSYPRIYSKKLFEADNPATLSFRVKLNNGSRVAFEASDTPDNRWRHAWRKTVNVIDDNNWHEYSVDITELETIRKLRINPGDRPGEAYFDWIRISDSNGRLLISWEFND